MAALVEENRELKAKVKTLESAFRKIEGALGVTASRARRVKRTTGKRRGRPPKSASPPAA